jgi:glycosyltransferase involved in cell wall biosynthesis
VTSRRLGIGVLVTYLPREKMGGAQLQAVRMAAELSKHHDVILFSRGDDSDAARLDLAQARLITRRPLNMYGVRMIADTPVGIRQIRKEGRHLDALVCYQSLAAGLLGVRAGRKLGIPCLVFVRGRHEYQMGRPSRFRLLVPYVFGAADRVLVQAEPLAGEILQQFDRPGLRRIRDGLRTRIGVVPNGVEAQPRRAGIGAGIVYVGRLIATKGIDELIDAMRRLPGEHLTLVGDGPERQRLEAKAAGLSVTFTGRVDHATAWQHIRDARCLALPSHTEAFPNVVLEAMASGVPVVAARTGGVPALVQDGQTGFLVDVGNVDQLVAALSALTRDEARCRAMGIQAHEAAAAFGWPRAVERLVEQIELARGARAGRHQ